MGSYLPEMVTEMLEPVRDFAHVKLTHNANNTQTIAALSPSQPHVFVVTADGYFSVYGIDFEIGGECVLLKQYSLLENGEGAESSNQ